MMFADDRSIENLQQLFVEFKKYLKLQKEYTKLEITENYQSCFPPWYYYRWLSFLAWWHCFICHLH